MGKRNELLSSAEKCTALWLTWELAGSLIAGELSRLLSQPIIIRAAYSDVDYWCCEFSGYCMDVATQERLLDAIGATESERQETLYYSDDVCSGCAQPIKSLGMEVTQKLLLMALGLNEARGTSITEKGLWVIYHTEDQGKGDVCNEF